MEYGYLFIILGAFGAFFMAFNNGANDVANAFASAVGSKALSMKLAVMIASVVTFSGALLLGGKVATKLVSQLVPPSAFANPDQYVVAMISVLLASGCFVLISTLTSLPVSSSQAIVGSLTGISILLAGWAAIPWAEIITIVSGWIISPLLAAGLALGLSWLVERKLIGVGQNVLPRVRKWLPVVVGITVCGGIYALLTVTSLKQSIGIDADSEYKSLSHEELMSKQESHVDKLQAYAAKLTVAVAENKVALQKGDNAAEIKTAETAASLIYDMEGESDDLLACSKALAPAMFYAQRWQVLLVVLVLFFPLWFTARKFIHGWLSGVEDSPEGAQVAFKNLQVGTSCYVAFAIGSNDVANSISPVFAIYLVVHAGGIPTTFSSDMPGWILLLGGVGMATGISVLGYRVMKTLGEKLTKINNARGFCIDFSVATSVVSASAMGIPVSTTHAATGAVVGSGLSKGWKSVQFGILGKIALGWLVTIPLSATITVILFKLVDMVL